MCFSIQLTFSHATDLPASADDQLRGTQRPRVEIGISMGLGPNETCDNAEATENSFEIMMDFLRILAGETEKTPDKALERESLRTELRVRWLLVQAENAEANFKRLSSIEWVERAIEYRRQALSLTPEGHKEKWHRLATLGSALNRRAERLGERTDINEAIEYQTQAMELIHGRDPNKLVLLDTLGTLYMRRFECLGELVDVDKAIECRSQAVLFTPDDHANKPAQLDNLGIIHMRRFELLGELEDVDKAIKYRSQAVLLIPDGHADKPAQLDNLGISHFCRFERLGELADVEKAIDYQAQAVLLTPIGHAEEPARLNNLGGSHMRRFERLGELVDMGKAIEYQTQAVLLTPDGHPHKSGRLCNLGGYHMRRFECLGELGDVGKAIECQNQAVLLTPDSITDKSGFLSSLGASYCSRFERLGELADVEKAIECQNQALQLTSGNHVDKPTQLGRLGISHLRRFECLGVLTDVDKAIECLTQAVVLTPDGHATKPHRLTNLGNSYQSRFGRLGELADLDKAIDYQTQAVLLTPTGHAAKPGFLNNLGNSHMRRFEHFGEPADVDKAIDCQAQAVLLTPIGHVEKAVRLNSLGGSHIHRFERLGELGDVGKAIECLTQAVLLTPNGHAERPSYLSNLGISHLSRFERLGELPDVDKAIECQTQALLLVPNGHAVKPTRLATLGESYMARFQHNGIHEDLESAEAYYQNAAQHIVTDPKAQIESARHWAKSLILLNLSPLPAYERCIELIPHLVWLGSTIYHRHTLLATISDLSTAAAAWAISVQAFDLAIEWLEQGRSVVWNQILHLRTPFDDLDAVDHALAQRLRNTASQLEGAGLRLQAAPSSTSTSWDLEQEAQHHRRLAGEWERLLQEARTIPGFTNFMRPRRAEELKLAATDGPVVLINTHTTRWDALIIFPKCSNVAHVPLDTKQQDCWGALLTQKPTCLVRHRGERVGGFGRVRQEPNPESPLKAMLAALWVVVVKPILDALTYTRKLPIAELPHVTWCATGALAFSPLHAAGHYDSSSPRAFDLVISSYTPTLSALLASTVPADSDAGVLAVGQQFTRGFPQLPSTVPELAAIKMHAKATRFLQLDGKKASVDAVLCAMDEYSWVHLACHATQDPVNPAHSLFYLSDGNLTLEAIIKRRFKNKGLAFLSACQTAKGDDTLPDEAVHLAAGVLMAGYPSVIATMWSIWDADGPEVADRVYAELLGGGKLTRGGAARALHKAIHELRQKIGEGRFERWVPFIHIGL